jgi:O-antigen ligase
MEQERVLRYIDQIILFCFCVLLIFLPIAHTETIRAFAMGIPAGLWIIKAILCRRLLFVRTPLDLPILLFTLVAGLSVVTAVDPRYSLQEFIGEWIIGIFLFYLVVNNVRHEQMKYILGALLLGNILMVGYGIFEFFRGGGQILNYGTRADSLHSGVGTFSTYLVTVIPYLLIAIFFVRETAGYLTFIPLLFLNLFALLLTYNRGSWIAMAALFFMVGWLFWSNKKMMFTTLALAVAGFLLLTPQGVLYYYHRFVTPGYPDSYHGRWILAKFSLEKIGENPFQMLGFGQRSFVKKFRHFDKYKEAQLWHAHNTFLNITLQTGLQGLVLFCFLLYRLLKYCHEKAKLEGNSSRKYYLTATFMMVISFFVLNLSTDFFIDDSALLFWFLVGMVFAFQNKKEKE